MKHYYDLVAYLRTFHETHGTIELGLTKYFKNELKTADDDLIRSLGHQKTIMMYTNPTGEPIVDLSSIRDGISEMYDQYLEQIKNYKSNDGYSPIPIPLEQATPTVVDDEYCDDWTFGLSFRHTYTISFNLELIPTTQLVRGLQIPFKLVSNYATYDFGKDLIKIAKAIESGKTNTELFTLFKSLSIEETMMDTMTKPRMQKLITACKDWIKENPGKHKGLVDTEEWGKYIEELGKHRKVHEYTALRHVYKLGVYNYETKLRNQEIIPFLLSNKKKQVTKDMLHDSNGITIVYSSPIKVRVNTIERDGDWEPDVDDVISITQEYVEVKNGVGL